MCVYNSGTLCFGEIDCESSFDEGWKQSFTVRRIGDYGELTDLPRTAVILRC